MNQQEIQSIIEEVLRRLTHLEEASKDDSVPVAVSARHCHLSQSDVEALFGEGYELTKKADLSQPGQFAANETIMLAGPKGSIENVRILGPARSLTQVEVSKTDSVKLGLKPPLRQSGDILGSTPITLVGPKGSLMKSEGLIIAQCHIHMTPDDAGHYGVEDGMYVNIRVNGERPVTFEKVRIRVSPKYRLEMHIDTDEANAGLISNGQKGTLIHCKEEKSGDQAMTKKQLFSLKSGENLSQELSHIDTHFFSKKLLTESEVKSWPSEIIEITSQTIVTPLARDAARNVRKVIKVIGSKGVADS